MKKKSESDPKQSIPEVSQDIRMNVIWDKAKSLFYHGKVDETLESLLPSANLRNGLIILVVAGVLAAVLSLVIDIETTYFSSFTYKALSDITGIAERQSDYSGVGPFALFVFLFSLPFSIVFSFIQDGVVFYALRLTGGKGTFTSQLYLSSIVNLSMVMASGVMFLSPLPCLNLIAFLLYFGLILYFLFIVRSKAYAMVHDLSYYHVLVVVLAVSVPALVIIYMANGAAAGFFNLPSTYVYNLGDATNTTGV